MNNKENKKVTRVPVVCPEGKPLMPMKPARVRKYIQSSKAVGKRNKIGVFYIQLVENPTGYNTQKLVAANDRGKCFTGIAAQTKNDTVLTFHLVLNGFYRSKKKTKDRQSVVGKMAKRAELRRTRRCQRINRKFVQKFRNHREKRFSNRKNNKIPPSVLANHLMTLRVLNEMAKILPIAEIVDEDCGGKTDKKGFGLSPVNVGQEFFREEAGKIAPVKLVSSYNTGSYRNFLGLTKDKSDKSKQCKETHANDAIALCAACFIEYKSWFSGDAHGHQWVGKIKVTESPFIVITRPKTFRKKLCNENFSKGGSRST